MSSIVYAHNIINLIVPTIVMGFVVYLLFGYMHWWNPLISGLTAGTIQGLCMLPLVISRIREQTLLKDKTK